MQESEAIQISFTEEEPVTPSSPALLASFGGSSTNTMMVVKANDLIQKSRYDLTLVEQKIVLRIIAMINPEDTELPLYEFSIQEFAQMCGIDATSGKNYSNIKKRLKSLADKSFYVTLPGTDTITLVRWIEKPYINRGSGTVKIKLDNDLKPFLLQLKDYFTQFNIAYTLPMKSQYSVRLYELFKSYENLHTITLDLEELKKVLQCEKYGQWTDFKRFVLETALAEINAITDIRVAYIPKKQARRITKLVFTITLLPEHERERALASANEKMKPSRLMRELAKVDAQGNEILLDDGEAIPALPYSPTKSGTIEFAAGADPARMTEELRLRADYGRLSGMLTESQLNAVDTIIKIVTKMAGNNTSGELVVNGGHKRTFLMINDIILKYSGMTEWFVAAAHKYDRFFERNTELKHPLLYMQKSVYEDIQFPEALVANYQREQRRTAAERQDPLQAAGYTPLDVDEPKGGA